MIATSPIRPLRRRDLIWLGLSVVGGFVCWAAWMGWNLYYDINPMTDEVSGPYEPWQILGSALSLLVVTLVTSLALRPSVAVVAYLLITAAYATGFCILHQRRRDLRTLPRWWCELLADRGDHAVRRRRYGNLRSRRAHRPPPCGSPCTHIVTVGGRSSGYNRSSASPRTPRRGIRERRRTGRIRLQHRRWFGRRPTHFG